MVSLGSEGKKVVDTLGQFWLVILQVDNAVTDFLRDETETTSWCIYIGLDVKPGKMARRKLGGSERSNGRVEIDGDGKARRQENKNPRLPQLCKRGHEIKRGVAYLSGLGHEVILLLQVLIVREALGGRSALSRRSGRCRGRHDGIPGLRAGYMVSGLQ